MASFSRSPQSPRGSEAPVIPSLTPRPYSPRAPWSCPCGRGPEATSPRAIPAAHLTSGSFLPGAPWPIPEIRLRPHGPCTSEPIRVSQCPTRAQRTSKPVASGLHSPTRTHQPSHLGAPLTPLPPTRPQHSRPTVGPGFAGAGPCVIPRAWALRPSSARLSCSPLPGCPGSGILGAAGAVLCLAEGPRRLRALPSPEPLWAPFPAPGTPWACRAGCVAPSPIPRPPWASVTCLLQ